MTSRRAFIGATLGLAALQFACQAVPAGRPTASPEPTAAPPASPTAAPAASPTAAAVASATAVAASSVTPAASSNPAGATTRPTAAAGSAADWPPVKELPAGQSIGSERVDTRTVRVDQVGYLPDARKLGLVAGGKASSFALVDASSGKSVYAAELGEPLRDEETGDSVRPADFSRFGEAGVYRLVVTGLGQSPDFRIGADVYDRLFADAVASYDQLADLAPTAWKTAGAKERKGGRAIDVTGGWPDAGDYGKYMPTATSSLATLMMLAELAPGQSGTGGRLVSPGYLSVLKRELDWMLKMQREDGAVYDKVTPLNFGGFDKGQDNIGGPLFVFDVTTPDTGSFAAVTAQASRLYGQADPAYSASLLAAARRAWSWLAQHPEEILPNPKEGTGGYALSSDRSQRLWASVELHRATGEAAYGDDARKRLTARSPSIGPLSWSDAQTYALVSYLRDEGADPTLRKTIASALTTWADQTATTVGSPVNPLRVSLSVYEWASNKTALDNAALLMLANQVAPARRYVDAALDQLHYVLGRNPMGKSYVTGYGQDSVLHPHNRTIFSIGRLVPGVLVGGPNGRAEDGIAPGGKGPRSYVDDQRAYSVNENAIDYNASLVLVAGLFSSV